MGHPFALDELDEHPAVRGTVTRLRLSVLAVVAGMVSAIAICVVAMRMAWLDGVDRGRAAASGGGRDAATDFLSAGTIPLLVVGAGGLALVGVALAAIVRAPAVRAREDAVELVRATRRLADSQLESFAALNASIEAKDRYTAGHGLRVTLVSILIGQELGLEEAQLDLLRHAATFHDIGKIAVPDSVLRKPGRLTDLEFAAMQVHPAEGARICGKLQPLREAMPLVRSHHERMDGRGYPDGLVGAAIPLGARIIAVADAWDAITSDRPYREGQPAFVALEEIRRSAGPQFDDRVVRAFIEVLAKDPWMFGLSPEDVADRRPLPAPVPPSRGLDAYGNVPDDHRRSDGGDLVTRREPEIDWAAGFTEDDIRAA